MTDSSSNSTSVTDAIEAMRSRGIDNADDLVSSTSPERIVASCETADKKGWSTRLLAWKIKEGGVDPSMSLPKVDRRAQFANATAMFPEGSVTESHRRMARRQWPGDHETCEGVMVVADEPSYPHLSVRCDGCGFEAAYPLRALLAGVLPEQPPVPSRPVPDGGLRYERSQG
jgi:hypothetical protein